MSLEKSASALFLDRDGTIVKDVPYCIEPDRVELVAGATQSLQALQRLGFQSVIITNQSLVGRGYGTEADVEAVNARIVDLLSEQGVEITDIKCAYEMPDAPPYRRKPNPVMIEEAAREHGINVARSAMVGDKPSDVEAGRRAGCGLNLLIDPDGVSGDPNAVASFAEAAERIIAWSRGDARDASTA